MVLICTGFEEFDRKIAENVEDSQIIFYPDFLLKEKGEVAVLSPKINTKIPFKDFLFALRQQDKRIVLILGDKASPYIGYALALGIYDIIFDPVTPDKVVEKIKHPSRFSDVQHLYLGLQGKVRFSGSAEDEQPAFYSTSSLDSSDIDRKIAEGILKFWGRSTKNMSLTEMLLAIEEEIIRAIT